MQPILQMTSVGRPVLIVNRIQEILVGEYSHVGVPVGVLLELGQDRSLDMLYFGPKKYDWLHN